MSERLTTEHLRIEYRDDPDLLALMDEYEVLRARVATLESICRGAGVCMSCLYGAPDPIGCTDCLGTGWDGGSPYEQIKVLEARVAKLEAALKDVRIDFEMWHEKTSIAKIDAALKDAPQ